MTKNDEIPFHKIPAKLEKCCRKKISVLWTGPSGIGKSSMVEQLTEKLGINCIDIRLTQIDAVDLRGLPVLSTNGTLSDFAPPNELPREGKGILFLDEITLAPVSVQNAAYQLILQRRLGKYRLPDGWVCFAASNTVDDNARVNELSSPLSNRFVHIISGPPPVQYWVDNFAIPNNINPAIISFLIRNPEWLHKFDKDNIELAWASPRSWEFFNNLIVKDDVDNEWETGNDELTECGKMAVGRQATAAFMTYMNIYSQIDVEQILSIPEKYVFPEKLDAKASVICCVALHVRQLDSNDNKTVNFLKLLARKDLSNEYTALGWRLAWHGEKGQEKLYRVFKDHPSLVKKLTRKNIELGIYDLMKELQPTSIK